MSENLEKRIRSRSIQKHDLEVNWNKAENFVPYKGEFIIYDIEVDEEGNDITQIVDGVKKTVYELVGRTTPYTYERIKLGDGKTKISELPFIDNTSLKYIEQELTEAQKAQARINIGAAEAETLIEIEDIDFIYDSTNKTWNKDPLKSYILTKSIGYSDSDITNELEDSTFADPYGHFCALSEGSIIRGEVIATTDSWGRLSPNTIQIKQVAYDGPFRTEHYRLFNGSKWTNWFKTIHHPNRIIQSESDSYTWTDSGTEKTIDKIFGFSGEYYFDTSPSYAGLDNNNIMATPVAIDPDDLIKHYGKKHFLSYDEEQTLSDEQMEIARNNIGTAAIQIVTWEEDD
ncbi:MAG: hypothetical protein J6A25_00820 [Lachnospiraceae bacterium]|nr:hypothetical protein [Lachnospiraceae bacterium]